MITKTKTFALCLAFALMQSVSAYAVIEPVKVMQYSIRNTSTTIEVIENTVALLTSVQNTILQGDIGAIIPDMPDMASLEDLGDFSPTMPAELESVISSKDAMPQIRGYIENELKNVNFDDMIQQRDALLDVSRRLNTSATEAIGLAKQMGTKLNESTSENKSMIKYAFEALTQHSKIAQENAFGIKATVEDAISNTLDSRILETTAQGIIAKVREKGINRSWLTGISSAKLPFGKQGGAK